MVEQAIVKTWDSDVAQANSVEEKTSTRIMACKKNQLQQ